MSFTCCLCHSCIGLHALAELPCSCLVCIDCSRTDLGAQVRRQKHELGASWDSPGPKQPRAGQTEFEPGDSVLYLNSQGVYVEAVVEIIDITVQPPQYGIQLPGADNLRFTEEHRLCSTKPRSQAPSKQRPQLSQTLTAHCPACRTTVSLPYLRLLAPEAVAAWEADRTASWLRVHDIIACPHAGCGALIQRVAAIAAGRGAATDADATSPLRGRSRGATPQAPNLGSAAHRERHRYRCGACNRDFCDSCSAAPYHNGFTCRQARAPDCLLCGGKVEEDRLEQLLPTAAAAVAAAAEDEDGDVRRPDGGAAQAMAMAVATRASRTELLRALKSKLEVDTVWCLERRDLEKAFLHWGCRTCSLPECATRRRGMCGRPLPCGHWCCGLRGEGDAVAMAATSASKMGTHPRCVECGADPQVASSPGGAVAAGGAATAMSTLVQECCFCWESLSSAPCIEMACGARHMCHLHCALARLAAGYPGPHISFTHLYCPLCRGGPGGGIGSRTSGTAVGSSPGGSSAAQIALAPVHLDHPALRAALEPHLALRDEVVAAVRARLRMDPALRGEPELRPGGRYDGRPADYGLEKLTFYKCSKCVKVYYGGQRACGAAAPDDAAQQQQQQGAGAADGAAGGGDQALLCGECCARATGTNCARHGTAYIEWKCRYCCSLASWFCFGTTHMCEPCHSGVARGVPRTRVVGSEQDACKDPKCGLKDTPHPPPGHEACLGCGMCRAGL